MDPTPIDGNALAGPLASLFTPDLTSARGICAGCGQPSLLAETRVYDQAPGLVARCTGCGEVLATVVELPDSLRLSLGGFRYLEIRSTPT
jgi:hypothetical protein